MGLPKKCVEEFGTFDNLELYLLLPERYGKKKKVYPRKSIPAKSKKVARNKEKSYVNSKSNIIVSPEVQGTVSFVKFSYDNNIARYTQQLLRVLGG